MSDKDPTPAEEVYLRLADAVTLAAALEWLREAYGDDPDDWDEVERLAFCGVVVLHAEAGVPVPDDHRERAASWLETEEIDWDPQPKRDARRRREIELLRRPAADPS